MEYRRRLSSKVTSDLVYLAKLLVTGVMALWAVFGAIIGLGGVVFLLILGKPVMVNGEPVHSIGAKVLFVLMSFSFSVFGTLYLYRQRRSESVQQRDLRRALRERNAGKEGHLQARR